MLLSQVPTRREACSAGLVSTTRQSCCSRSAAHPRYVSAPPTWRVAAIEALPLGDASVDVVLSSLMMHHQPGDLKSRGLAEVRRVLKPGGRLLIVDLQQPSGGLARLALTSLIHGHMEHDVHDLPKLITAAGFEDVRDGETGFSWLGFAAGRAPRG